MIPYRIRNTALKIVKKISIKINITYAILKEAKIFCMSLDTSS